MTESKRIVLNTLATYGRSLVALGFGLFSSRWILAALGETDFGLYGVVGSIIVFITFFNGVLGSSVTRYYAYVIGGCEKADNGRDPSELMKWFNTSFSIHLVAACVLTLVGYPIGEYAIRHWLVIPPDRVMACVWVLRLSMVTAFIGMLSIPFVAFYTAYQYIAELAVWSVLATVIVFVSAYWLESLSGDRLIWYAFFMMLAYAAIPACQIVRARFKFSACRIRIAYWWDGARTRELVSFSGWQLFGNCGAMVRSQACAVLTNLYFGPKVNAAYAVSGQVSAHTGTLSQALIGAFTPAVTAAEGSGNRAKMIDMAWRTSRFGALLILLFIIPLSLELPEVLRLWLKNPPEYAASLTWVAFVEIVCGKLTVGNQLAISAEGRIAAYQVTIGSIMISTLFVAWGLIGLGVGPMSVVYGCLITSVMATIGRVWFTRRQLSMSITHWLRRVVLPIAAFAAITGACGYLPHFFMAPSFLRVCVTTCFTSASALVFGWLLVLDRDERTYVASGVSRAVSRMRRRI